MRALCWPPRGSNALLIQAEGSCALSLSTSDVLAQATALGQRVAQQLIAQGAVASEGRQLIEASATGHWLGGLSRLNGSVF